MCDVTISNSLNDVSEQEENMSLDAEQEENMSLNAHEKVLKNKTRPLRKKKKVIKDEAMDTDAIPTLRKGRHDLPLREKIKILEMLANNTGTSQRDIASTFKVSQSQISRIFSNKESIKEEWQKGNAERKRNRKGKGGLVEQKLLEWYNEAIQEGLPITGPILMEKAKTIVEDFNLSFVPSSGWFRRWKKRNGIVRKVPAAKNKDGSVSYTRISSHWRRYTFTKVIKDRNPEDVWFLDSLHMFSHVLPCHSESIEFEGSDKGKVFVLFAFNYLGTKIQSPLIVGTESAFMDDAQLNYFNHNEGEISQELFTEWLIKWDKELKVERRRISLLLCKAPYISEGLNFNCISLHYFPEGDPASLRLQPFYFNISTTFKALFRHQVASHHFSNSACKELASEDSLQERFQNFSTFISLVDRIYMIKRAWKHIHPDVFVRGIVKAGLSRKVRTLTIEAEVSPPPGMTEEEFEQFVHIDDAFTDSRPIDALSPEPPRETLDFEALLACNILREYLQKSSSNLVDNLAEIENAVQREVISSNNQMIEDEPSIDPFFDSSSLYSIEGHKTSVVNGETLKFDEPISPSSPVQPPSPAPENPPLETGISVETLPINDYTNQVATPKYVETYSIPTNSQEILISHPSPQTHVVCESLKPTCQVTPLTHEGQAIGQYQTANYIQAQSLELKSIPIGIPRAVSDINLDRFTLHSEVPHPRPINEVNSHLIPATQLTNSTPTFITFAPHF